MQQLINLISLTSSSFVEPLLTFCYGINIEASNIEVGVIITNHYRYLVTLASLRRKIFVFWHV